MDESSNDERLIPEGISSSQVWYAGGKLWSNRRSGVGIYTSRMMQKFPALPVEEEGSLEDQILREEFIQKVLSYHRSRMPELT